MSESTKITCDGCGATDINYTGNSVDYYVGLGNLRCSPWFTKEGKTGGMVTDVMIYPPIEGGEKHFCGVACLATWLQKTHPSLFAASKSSTQENK